MRKLAVLYALLVWNCAAYAQEHAATGKPEPSTANEDARMQALEDQVRSLADEVAVLRGELKALRNAKFPEGPAEARLLLAASHIEPGTASSSAAPGAPSVETPQLPQTQATGGTQLQNPPGLGGATSNAKLLNPDISLIGDFIGTVGRNNVSPSRSLELHESEVGMQPIIDPYARADAFISFGEEGVNVEEGYVTFTALPAGLLMKVGKMRAEFGKVNTIHNHALQYIDRPLATNNLIGGEDGIDDAGLSLTRFIPAPKGWFAEGTAQVFRGDSDDLFTAHRREDLSVVGHLRAYRALSESTNLDLGVSYARGHNNSGDFASDPSAFLTNLYAADATVRWNPLRRAIYNSFLFRTELFWSAHDQLSPAAIF